jgi:hypothetical protein
MLIVRYQTEGKEGWPRRAGRTPPTAGIRHDGTYDGGVVAIGYNSRLCHIGRGGAHPWP